MATEKSVPVAPGALPVLGHTLAMARDPFGFFERQSAREPIIRILLGRRNLYLVNSPPLVRQIQLAGNGREFDKGGALLAPFIKVLGRGLPLSPNARHRIDRPLVQPAFHHDRFPDYVTRIQTCVDDLTTSWRPGQILDVDAEMTRLTTAILPRTLFLGDRGAETVILFQRNISTVMAGSALRTLLPAVDRIPFPGNRRYRDSVARIGSALESFVRSRMADDLEHTDLVGLLLRAGNQDIDTIREHIFGFLVGGIETSAALLGWTLHLLSSHPDHFQRLRAEIDDVLGGERPTIDDIPRLDYLKRVVTEVLRLFPPVWLTSRTTLVDTELGGYRIPRESDVFFCCYAIHRNATIFSDPQKFDPDRWCEERVGKAQREAYMPFSVGARRCIGDIFGLTEVSIALAMFVQGWHFEQVSRRGPKPYGFITQHPKGLRLRVSLAPRTRRGAAAS